MLFWQTVALGIAFLQQSSANVIGIDFGSDSMKVGIVQPGLPLGEIFASYR
jgi:hypothetical protein